MKNRGYQNRNYLGLHMYSELPIYSEIHLVCCHTLRLLLKKKQTLFVFTFSLLFFFFLLFFLEDAKEEKSVVFIGVMDEDQTVLSEMLTERSYAVEVFGVL